MPSPTVTATADESLTVFWDRLRQLGFVPALDHLQPLPAADRNDPLFGIDDALVASDPAAPIMRGSGASLDRLELRWDQLEPAPNVYDFSSVDDALASGRQLHYRVLAVVDGTPAWAALDRAAAANSPPTGLEAPALLPSGAPNPANPWAAFLATLAARYGTGISAWELWNEPNSPQFWSGTPAQYARLLTVGQAVLGRDAPSATIVMGGMVSDDGSFLRAVVAARCAAAACPGALPSAIGWHVYDNPADIERVATLSRKIFHPLGADPQIWITEANVPADDPEAPADAVTGPDGVSLARQAAFVMQAYVLARVAGIHTLSIYRASDVDDQGHYWGLLRDDFTARPALQAYRTAAEWLSGAQAGPVSRPQPGVTLVPFCRLGATILAAWNDGPQPATVPITAAQPPAKLIDMSGRETALEAAGGSWQLRLPAAPAPTLYTVPLGIPELVVTAQPCR